MAIKGKVVGHIYVSSKYSDFHFHEENRSVAPGRVLDLVKSISEYGYLMNPILVNEKMEIIDGQGRFCALKELGLPVYFVVQKGIGGKECLALNIWQRVWVLLDYCQYYEKTGNQNYARLNKLQEFSGGINHWLLYCVGKNIISTNGSSRMIRDGEITFSDDEYKKCIQAIDFMKTIKRGTKAGCGKNLRLYLTALCWCYLLEGVNRERLQEIVETKYDLLMPLNTIDGVLKNISEVYNKGLPNNKKIAFDALYTLSQLD